VEAVVPTVATTRAGVRPEARSVAIAAASASGRIAKSPSTSTVRTDAAPRPAIRAAFSMDEWPCVEV
jgi:hypothetical protein